MSGRCIVLWKKYTQTHIAKFDAANLDYLGLLKKKINCDFTLFPGRFCNKFHKYRWQKSLYLTTLNRMLMSNINWLLSPAECHILPRCWGPGLHFLYKSLCWFPCRPELGNSGGQKVWELILANQTALWEMSAWYWGMKRRRRRQGGLGREQGRQNKDRKEMCAGEVEKKRRGDSWSGWWRAWQWPGVWESNWTPEYREDRWVINH